MPDFKPYTRAELDRCLSFIEKSIYTVVAGLEITAWRTPEPVAFLQRQQGEELHLAVGDCWGKLFDCAWFRFTGRVPATAAGQAVVLLLDVNGELCVMDAAGNPLRGLTNVASDFDLSLGWPGKRVLPLFSAAQGGEAVEVWADGGANDLFGNLKENGAIKEAAIAVCHEEVRGLFYDFEVLLDLLKTLPLESTRAQQVLTALDDARWKVAFACTDETARAAREILRPMLEKRGGDPAIRISAIGHAHIDLGWLWPIRETRRKGARTFSTALANLERYPHYHFGASQAQLFQFVKEDYPALYERVKQAVKEGRFEVQGAMWVEADTNLSGAEALVRQILYGKRFFKDEFGVEVRNLWLPDAFGYSGALPQILRLAGVDYFMTQKMSWNLVNHFPYHSFHWQGIDGTQVLAHLLPEETYDSPALPRSVTRIDKNYYQKGVSDHALMLFGIGDGGGGPGEEHIERLERIQNLAGIAPVKQEPAADFFEVWKKDAGRFPTWVGEMYLERHAGTLTTEAKNKWYNRRMEQALRQLEWTILLAGVDYPKTRLDEIWREVLLYQFHDILPGSSIKRVYDESVARYSILLGEVQGMIRSAEQAAALNVDTQTLKSPALVFNSLSWQRSQWLKIGETWKKVAVPALGYCAVDAAAADDLPALTASPTLLENDCLRVEFAADGSIFSIWDKSASRQAVADGQHANRLAVYRDTGDAWDFALDYRDQTPQTMQLVSSEAHVDGPRAVLLQTYSYGRSELVQEISLTAGSPCLEFDNRLRWCEINTMLRTSLPAAVHADEATYEIQFGVMRRSTHRNTTWDLARDETVGHKYADLSQGDYGVALLNDSKYGHRVKENVLDLNLLRSVLYPGPRHVQEGETLPGQPDYAYTDQAEHVFRYAFYPHKGDCAAGRVAQAGYEFNIPLRSVSVKPQAGSRPACFSWLSVDAPNVIVEAVKQAEDSRDVIVRLYETTHAGVRAGLHFGFTPQSVSEVTLMEEPLRPLELTGDRLELEFKPFEIKTLKVSC